MRPSARSASRTAVRASNRSMPSNWVRVPGDAGVLVEDAEHRQVVPAADLEVVGVVRRRDLHRAGAERRVDVLVRHHGDQPAGQRQQHLGADQVAVALVVGVHRHGRVPEHRLDPGRRDVDRAAVQVAVAHRDELALDLAVLDLDVGQAAAQHGRPVDEPLGAVDEPVVVQALEDVLDGPREPVVHREPLTAPVDAVAEAGASGAGSRRRARPSSPRALDERLATELLARGALRRQLALDQRVDGDACVVHAGEPQRLVPLHAAAPDRCVDQRVLERVPDVQGARHVGRRDDDAERRPAALRVGGEVAALDPALVQRSLYLRRRVVRREVLRRGGRG
jgi:hypothetical protein